MNAAFFNAIRPMFGTLSQSQVNGIETLLAATSGLEITQRAYLLATAYHETARTMQPVRETLARTSEEAVRRLDRHFRNRRSNRYWTPDAEGKSWHGRGYVQLTHRANYERAGANLDVDLVSDPDRAMHPDVAARILVRGCLEGWFTGKRLADYLPGDYVNARRVVNGLDKANAIAGYARQFEAALRHVPRGVKVDIPPTAGLVVAIGAALLFLRTIWSRLFR